VIRVKGKIVSIALMAVIFTSLLMNLGFIEAKVGNTVISVEPGLVEGLPGDSFTVDITIDKAENVYAWEFKLKYPPYRAVLAPTNVEDGGFLTGGYLFSNDNPFDGILLVGATKIGVQPGVSGSGVLARITFFVLEAGEGPLEIMESDLLDPSLNAMDHQTRDGFYSGPVAELVRKNLPLGRDRQVGDMQEFNVKIRNPSDVPLHVYAEWEMTRLEDGAYDSLRDGQWSYGFGPLPFWFIDPLYVDGYYKSWADGFLTGVGWNQTGANPYLDAVDYPSNYVWKTGTPVYNETTGEFMYVDGDADMSAAYTFEDIPPLNEGESISRVILEGYTQCDNIYPDLDVYTQSPTIFDWLGSLYGETTWGWHTPRWLGPGECVSTIVPDTRTEAGLNAFEVILYNYMPGEAYAGTMMCDAMRLQVELTLARYIPEVPEILVIPPNTPEFDLPTTSMGPHTEYDVGTYMCSVTLYYSYGGTWFNPAAKSQTFKWFVSN
jgi:hypothetical protein